MLQKKQQKQPKRRNGGGIGRSGDGGNSGSGSAGLFFLGGGRSERSHRRGTGTGASSERLSAACHPGELAELTAYYELWHEPEGTTLEEMWEKKDNQYDQWREQETSNPGFYRYYGGKCLFGHE